MADVFSQRSENGGIVAMLRHEERPDGSRSIEIECGAPDVAVMILSREDARRLGEALIAGSYAADPEATGEAAARGGYIHLRPEIVDRRLGAAMTMGF